MEIIIFGSNEADNRQAIEILSSIEGIQIQTVPLAAISEGKVKLPFIETADGQRHYGLHSIQNFVSEFKVPA